jgi:hypothetical protein
MNMSRKLVVSLVLFLAGMSTGMNALAQENLSSDRGLGFGLQGPCVFSVRYWASETLAIEANAFALTTDYVPGPDMPVTSSVYGCVAGKLLLKLGDLNSLDFYVAAWGELPFGEYSPFRSGPEALGAAIVGGLEWSILRNFAVNFEFGEMARFTDKLKVDFAFSVGLHYYFSRATENK